MAFTWCNSYYRELRSRTTQTSWVYRTRMFDGTKPWILQVATSVNCDTHISAEIPLEAHSPGTTLSMPVYKIEEPRIEFSATFDNNIIQIKRFPSQVSLTERQLGFQSIRIIGSKTWFSCPNIRAILGRSDSWRSWEKSPQLSKEIYTYTYSLNGCSVFRGSYGPDQNAFSQFN